MTSSIIRSNNFNIMQKTNTNNNGVSLNANNTHNLNSILFNNNSINNGLRVFKNPDLKNNYNINNNNKTSNFIYNIKNAVMESKYFQNITNSELNNNININNNNNIAYKNLGGNSSSNNNNNNNQASASLALMNKIRAIESRKKRVATSIATTNSPQQQQQQQKGSNSRVNGSQHPDEDKPKPLNSSTPAPQFIPMATCLEINKLRKNFNKSQLDAASNKNSDQFKDKVSDQKFFDRNYKLNDKISTTPIPSNRSTDINEKHYSSNTRLSNQIEATKIQINNSTSPNNSDNNGINNGTSANPNSFNKLKLLKKRNLNKKLNSVNNYNTAFASKSQSNLDSISKLTDDSDDIENYNTNQLKYSNGNMLDHHKSSQTVDELYLYEINAKSNKSNLNEKINNGLTRSSNAINMHFTPAATPSSKAKSDNCLLELISKTNQDDINSEKKCLKQNFLPKFSKSSNNMNTVTNKKPFTIITNENIIKPMTANPLAKSSERVLTKSKTELNINLSNGEYKFNIDKNHDTTNSSEDRQKLLEFKKQKEQVNTNSNITVTIGDKAKQTINNNSNEFRIIYPGTQDMVPKPSIFYYNNNDEIDDNFIISEEFKRLFQEDEYFKEVFRKCHQWLIKHVIPNMPKITEKLKKAHKIPN